MPQGNGTKKGETMNQENKKPNLGAQAGQREAARRSSDAQNITEKKMAVKLCPLKQALCLEKRCAWWVEGTCAIVRVVDVLAAQ